MEKYTVEQVADLVEESDVETESESEIDEDASFPLPQCSEDEEDPVPDRLNDEDSSLSIQSPTLQGLYAKTYLYM